MRAAHIAGLAALRQQECPAALSAFNQRLDARRRPEFALDQIGLLATWCGPEAGLAHLDYFLQHAARGYAVPRSPVLRLRDRLMDQQGFWDAEWQRLLTVLQDATTEPHGASPHSTTP